MTKIKNIKKLNVDNVQKTFVNECQTKIKKLTYEINRLIENSANIDVDNKEMIGELDNQINNTLFSLEYCEELVYSSKDEELIRMVRRLNTKYRLLQNYYISNKINLINEKIDFTKNNLNSSYEETVSNINKKQEEVKKNTEESIKEIKNTTNSITSNMLFSIAAIFLGISITSAMVTGMANLEPQFYLLYFSSILFSIIIVIGFAAIIIKNDVEKSKQIIITIGLALGFWLLICLITYFIL